MSNVVESNTNIEGYLQVSDHVTVGSQRNLNVTLSQSGNTVTCTTAIFSSTYLGAVIYWADKTTSFIKSVISSTQVTVVDSTARSSQIATVYHDGTQSCSSGVGSTMVAGNTVEGNTVSAIVDVIAGNNITAGNDIIATVDVTAGRDVIATVDVTAGRDVNATGNVNATHDLVASRDALISKNTATNTLTTVSTADVGTDLTVGGDAVITGTTTTDGLVATSTIAVSFTNVGDLLVSDGNSGNMVSLPAVGNADGEPLITDGSVANRVRYGTLLQTASATNFLSLINGGSGWSLTSGPNTATVMFMRIGRFIMMSINLNSSIYHTTGSVPFAITGSNSATNAPSWAVLPSGKNPQVAFQVLAGASANASFAVLRRGTGSVTEWAVGIMTSPTLPFTDAVWAIGQDVVIPYFAVSWMDDS